MAREFVHQGDVGVEFLFTFVEKDGTTPVNLTGATTVEAKIEKKGGAGVTWTLSVVSAAAGTAKYTSSSDDLDIEGVWAAMGHTVIAGVDSHYKKVSFEVLPVLAGA